MSEFNFRCPHCQKSLKASNDMLGQTINCPSCKEEIKLPAPEQAQTKVSGLAIASLVLGVLCISIPAVIFGHIAYSKIKQFPNKLTGTGMALAGLILGYLQIASIIVVVMLSIIAIPTFAKNRNLAEQNRCINNLRMVDAAKQQAAIEMGWSDTTDCTTYENAARVNAYLRGGAPTCPSGGTYDYRTVSENPTCTVHGNVLPIW